MIGQIVKKEQRFIEIQDVGERHLEFLQQDFRHHRYVLRGSSNVSSNFGDDR